MNITMETTAPLSVTARKNAKREAKQALLAQRETDKKAALALRVKPSMAEDDGDQHVWHVTMTLAGDAIPGDSIVVASTPEFVKQAMLDQFVGRAPDVLAALVLHADQLDDGRFEGPFTVITGKEIDGPFGSLLEATNYADDVFDIENYNEGSRVIDSNGKEVLHLSLATRDTGVVRYRPGYYH